MQWCFFHGICVSYIISDSWLHDPSSYNWCANLWMWEFLLSCLWMLHLFIMDWLPPVISGEDSLHSEYSGLLGVETSPSNLGPCQEPTFAAATWGLTTSLVHHLPTERMTDLPNGPLVEPQQITSRIHLQAPVGSPYPPLQNWVSPE